MKDGKRTMKDLIAELDEESIKHWLAVIVVRLDGHPIFVRATTPDKQQVLVRVVKGGGRPLGLIIGDQSQNGLSMSATIYPENVHPWGEQCRELMDQHIALVQWSEFDKLPDATVGQVAGDEFLLAPNGLVPRRPEGTLNA